MDALQMTLSRVSNWFQTSVWGSFLGATRLWFGHGLAFLGPKSGRCWAGGNPKSQLLMGGIPIGSMYGIFANIKGVY